MERAVQRVVSTEKIPILLWLDQLDEEAMDQARHLANLDCAFHHVAIMADAHVGYGMPIGGVLATVGAIIPNGVGVDIGCGMQAVRTGLQEVTSAQLRAILGDLRRMNVAITRARMKLVILGDAPALTRHVFYKEL